MENGGRQMGEAAENVLAPVRVNPVLTHAAERRRSLDPRWCFRLDPEDVGVGEGWFGQSDIFQDTIEVPGCWQGQGFGSDESEMVWDFRLMARTFRATYKGTGWYASSFEVPDAWESERVWMMFGGAHPSAQVWLNGVELGNHGQPFVPFGFEITDVVNLKAQNDIVVRVHEADRIFGMAYSWQGNWSGLYRGVEIVSAGSARIEQLRCRPDLNGQAVDVSAQFDLSPKTISDLTLRATVTPVNGRQEQSVKAPVVGNLAECRITIPSPQPWSPDSPNLYRVDAEIVQDGRILDAVSERIGFVSLSTDAKHFLINDEPYYMRGTGEFIPCPETGSPDTDRDRLRKRLKTLRDYGYNYVRLQSYAQTPEYYDVADEVGLLIQSEMGAIGAWGGNTPDHVYQWPQPTPRFRDALTTQWNNVVLRDVNHPSANLYCLSNEYGADTDFPRSAWKCYNDTKKIKPTALVIWTDGGLNEDLPQDFVNDQASRDGDTALPLIQHEYKWWSSFPDVALIERYSGAMRPYAAEIAIKAAAKQGISHTLAQGAKNSQHLQLLESKAKMEACRRDYENLAGICHFNAMDGNPSPQGVIDEFYERKIADAASWLETNGDAVIMCSLGFDDRVVEPGDLVSCDLHVSDFSHPPLSFGAIGWELSVGKEVVSTGTVKASHQPYRTYLAGQVEFTAPQVMTPTPARLIACITDGDRVVTNRWDLWVFPHEIQLPSNTGIYGTPEHTWLKSVDGIEQAGVSKAQPGNVLLTERVDAQLLEYLNDGGRAVLVASEGLVRPYRPLFGMKEGHYFFTPPANYPPNEDGHDGTIIADHPMLGDMPHEGYTDLQFFRMITDSPPLDLTPLGLNDGDPVIRVMHSYLICHPLGYLVERRVGQGALIICALNLEQKWPEARYMLSQLLRHAQSDDCRPELALNETAAKALLSVGALP